MKVNRRIINISKISKELDDGYVKADRAQLLSMVWEITEDAWSFIKEQNAEQRLQRDATVFIRRGS